MKEASDTENYVCKKCPVEEAKKSPYQMKTWDTVEIHGGLRKKQLSVLQSF